MLQSIRDGIQGWISALIIGVICVPFAFWGVTSYFTGGGEVVVADVDGGEISQRDFQQAYQSRYQAEQRRLGNAADLIDEQSLKLQVLETMVSRESLTQHVSQGGYDISDAKLVEALRGNPYLQEDGEFSQSRYGQLLAALGMDAATYEESLRRSLRVGQLQNSLSETSLVSDAEVERLWKLQNQTRSVTAAQIKVAELAESMEVSAEDIKDWYEDNLDDYYTEERARVSYIELTVADLAGRVDVSDADIEERYEEDKDRYITPEQRRARHILITGTDDVAEEKLKALKARIEAGEDFAELAKANSDDPGSAAEGGDLGLVSRGVMVKPFEEALFDLDEPGELSDIIETQFGLHLIRLDEIQEEQGQTLAEATVEIDTALRAEKAEELYVELLDQLSELSYENPAELESTAEALELTVRVSGWFTRDRGTGISADDDIRSAAFSNTVLQDKENSDVIELGDERAIVLRENGYEPAEQRSLADVSDEIEAALRNRLAAEKAEQIAEALVDAVEDDGRALSDAVKASGFEASDLGAIKRDSSAMNAVALRDVFALPRPEADKPEVGSTELLNGDVVVYVLTAVNEADLTSDTAKAELEQLRDALEAQRGRSELFATLRDIRENTSVKLHVNRL